MAFLLSDDAHASAVRDALREKLKPDADRAAAVDALDALLKQ